MTGKNNDRHTGIDEKNDTGIPFSAVLSQSADMEAIASISETNPIRSRRKTQPEMRIQEQPGFVLHSYVYKESSLIVDIFSRDHGRMALVAKGAKRPHSRLRSVLQTFQPLSLNWSGKSELRNLVSAEWVGGMVPLESSVLLYGFYLNELLLKLTAREDPHPGLFDHYVTALARLANTESAQIVLRQFELAVLKETGVAADLSVDAHNGGQVEPDEIYVVDPEKGPRPARISDVTPRVTGKTLLDMTNEDYSDSMTQVQSKLLMRALLAHHLNGAQIQTRQILIDLMQL
ncbi:MAG: DNA repair protein RecO [Betaproteobacteria bacterium]|nr:DNA repair protein RecO [Betaproteobacteria bacterium]